MSSANVCLLTGWNRQRTAEPMPSPGRRVRPGCRGARSGDCGRDDLPAPPGPLGHDDVVPGPVHARRAAVEEPAQALREEAAPAGPGPPMAGPPTAHPARGVDGPP